MMDLKPYVPERIRRLQAYKTEVRGQFRVLLDANELPYELPAAIREKIQAAVAAAPIHRYPDPEAHELRLKLSEELVIGPDQIMVGNGSDDLIQMIATAFSKPRGGRERARMFYFDPSFSMYRIIAEIAGCEAVPVPLGPDCDIDLAAYDAARAGGEPNVVFIGYPNNPTGKLFDRSAIERILDRGDAVVVVDEAYHDYADDTFVGDLDRLDNLIVLRTFSKIGAAGLRLGVAAAQPDLLDEMNKVRLPFNVNLLTQRIAMLLVDHRDQLSQPIARVVNERGRLIRDLRKIGGLEVVDSAANFVFFRAPGRAEALYEGLKARGILIRNLSGKGLLQDALRVTVGTEPENREFLKATAEVLAG